MLYHQSIRYVTGSVNIPMVMAVGNREPSSPTKGMAGPYEITLLVSSYSFTCLQRSCIHRDCYYNLCGDVMLREDITIHNCCPQLKCCSIQQLCIAFPI